MPPRGGGGPPLHQTHFALHHFAFHFALQQLFTLHHLAAAGAKGKASRWFRVKFGANGDCLHREQAGWWFNSGYLDGMPWVQRKMCDQGCTIMMCHSDFDCFNFGPWCSSRSWGHLFSRTKFIVSFDLTFTFWRSELSLSFKCFLFFRRPSSCLEPTKEKSINQVLSLPEGVKVCVTVWEIL